MENTTPTPSEKKFSIAGLLQLILAIGAIIVGLYLVLNAPAATPADSIEVPSYTSVAVAPAGEMSEAPATFKASASAGTVSAFEAPTLKTSVGTTNNDPGYTAFGGDAYTYIYKAARYCVVDLDYITTQLNTINSNMCVIPSALSNISEQVAGIATNQGQVAEGLSVLSTQVDYITQAVISTKTATEQSNATLGTIADRVGEGNVLTAQVCNSNMAVAAQLSMIVRILYLGFGAILILAGGILVCKVRLKK